MNVIVDGVVFELQARGGISRMFHELLPGLLDHGGVEQLDLLVWGRPSQPLPRHPRLRLRPLGGALSPLLRSSRLAGVREGVRRRAVARATAQAGGLWHSTYYTPPPHATLRSVVSVYDMIAEDRPREFVGRLNRVLRRDKRRCVQRGDRIVCISRCTRDRLLRHIAVPEERVHVVPLACPACFEADTPRWTPPVPFFLYVGARSGYKNFSLLRDAWELWAPGKPVRLVVAGLPWSRAERQVLSSLSTRDRIQLLPSPADEELQHLYLGATALVMPSVDEGFGLPLLEASSAGCGIVASDICAFREVAPEGTVYFSPSSAQSLAAALDHAWRQAPTRPRPRPSYSWADAARAFGSVYAAALAHAR